MFGKIHEAKFLKHSKVSVWVNLAVFVGACFAVVQIFVMEFRANYLASQMDFTMSQINCVNCMALCAQDITVRQLHSTVTTKLSSASFLA